MSPSDSMQIATIHAFGALGYGITAALFLLLAILLLKGWRGRMQGGLLVAAVVTNALWAGFLTAYGERPTLPPGWLWGVEALRYLTWLAFLVRLLELQLRAYPKAAAAVRWSRLALVILILGVALPFEGWLQGMASSMVPEGVSIRMAAAALLALAGLVGAQQVYRNTPLEHRWAIRYLAVGVGALFAYDLFFFSEALLARGLDDDLWLARGVANALAVPLIAVSAARNPQWSFNLFVSRTMVLHTASLIGAGLFLLLVFLADYYIRLFAGAWSGVLQPILIFGSALLFVVLVVSGHSRAWLKVFVNKHFFRYKYDYREEWLHLIRVLSGKAFQGSLSERIIFALGELVDCPGGALWLCPESGPCEHECSWQLPGFRPGRSTDLDPLRDFLRRKRWIVDLRECEADHAAYDGLVIPPWIREGKRLWLCVPLFHEDGLLGFVLLARPRGPQQLNWETLDLLKTAASQAASYLALEKATRALADARQLEGFHRLSAFVIHDLKNLIAQLLLVVRNAERHKQDPNFLEDAMVTVRNSVDKMTRLLAQLRTAMPAEGAERVSLGEVLREVVSDRGASDPCPRLVIEAVEPCVLYADRDRLAAVVGHIVQNAQEATPKDGMVTVRLRSSSGEARVEVIDTGVGMDEAFVRERLFKPFDSTKGLAGIGIGAFECREFVRSLGGRIEVETAPGRGTRFVMIFPLGEAMS